MLSVRSRICLVAHLSLLLIVLAFSYPSAHAQFTQEVPRQTVTGSQDCSVLRESNESPSLTVSCAIAPSDDAYVDNLMPSKALGGSGVLIVQNTPSIPVSKNYAFLKFDLRDNLPSALVESMSKPSYASLQLYVRLMNFHYNATVEVHNAPPSNWTENEITWNNMPQIEQDYVSKNILQNGTWAQWNLTRLIQPAFNASGDITLAVVSSETAWRNLIWFDSNEYPFLNGKTAPTLNLTFNEPFVTIETPYDNIPISIGNTTVNSDTNGTARMLLPWGDYTISVPETIPMSNGTRAAFEGWSDETGSSTNQISLGNNLTVRAIYGIQHLLEASSPYGYVTGGGWYFEDARANITVEPGAVPIQGVSGWVGGRYVFDHWTGDCNSSNVTCSIIMDGPKVTVAVWRVDWTQTIAGSLFLIVSSLILAAWIARRKKTKTQAKGDHGKRTRRHQSSRGRRG